MEGRGRALAYRAIGRALSLSYRLFYFGLWIAEKDGAVTREKGKCLLAKIKERNMPPS